VLLHELAHIARYDDWTNLFARLIAAILPIHPVAVWLIKQIGQEREVACDDWVVAMTGEARPYAASLTRLFELCSARRRQLLATGMADQASHLGERIEALLRSGRDFAPRVSLVRVALGAMILVGLVFAGAQAPHWVAFAQESPVAPVAPLPPMPPSPPLAQAVPVAPVPAVEPQPPQAPQAPLAALLDDVNNQIRVADSLIQERDAELLAVQAQLQDQREHGRSTDEIRAAEAQLQARKAQVVAMRAQLEQQRAAEQNRASAPGGSFLAALVAAGYGNLSVDEIIDLRNHGVTADYLRAVGEAGLGKLSTKELIAMTEHGVQPELIRALRQAFPQITVAEIVEAAESGLNVADLRQAREFSPNLTFPQVIKLKQAGVI
jgi:hypothetical protein